MSGILALDGALGSFSVCVLDGELELAERIDGRAALERGLALVDSLLARSGRRLSGIAAIAAGIGPGGFSGLRIALGYAKGLALGAGLPIVGVSSFDALEPPGLDGAVASLVALKPGHACARLRIAGSEGAWLPSVRCGAEAEVAAWLAEALGEAGLSTLACCGDVKGVAARLGERAITVRSYPTQDRPAALAIARLAASRPQETFGSPHALRPDYGPLPAFATHDGGKQRSSR